MSDAAEKPAAAPAAGGNKKLLLMVLVFNVLIAGGLGYMVMSNRSHANDKPKAAEGAEGEKAEGEKAEGEAEPEAAEPDAKGGKHAGKFGPLLDVGSFVANLSNTGTGPGRYAKVSLFIEVANEDGKNKVEAALVPIRSEALMFLSNAKPEDVIGQDKIRALSDELLKRFNALVGKGSVRHVYFSELVVQ